MKHLPLVGIAVGLVFLGLLNGVLWPEQGIAAENTGRISILCPGEAASSVSLAAKEVRRYVYLRTGELLPVVPTQAAGDMILLTQKDDSLIAPFLNEQSFKDKVSALKNDDYVLKTERNAEGEKTLLIIGGSPIGTLYGAYRFAEILGVRFYLEGDVIPDKRIPLTLPDLDETASPLFRLRGIQPFHDFPEGPDWWGTEDYKAIIAQLPKLRMNFIGLHTYPIVEPTVWIGQEDDFGKDGHVSFSYPARYYNTALTVGWGFTARKTGDYSCGASVIFEKDDYGADVMDGLTPEPDSLDQSNEMFNRVGNLFHNVFTLARNLGIKTCIGTETPLTVPQPVRARLDLPEGDVTVEGGQNAVYPDPIEGTEDDPLYQSVRYGLNAYHIKVPNGSCTVTLKFCEVHYDHAGARVFGVSLEDKQVIERLDIFETAGKDKALDYTFKDIAVSDGSLDIGFLPIVEFPAIAAICVEGNGVIRKIDCGGPGSADYLPDVDAARLPLETIEEIYAGIFKRIMKTHPLDYYWFWTPEGWTWEGTTEQQVKSTIDDIRAANRAAKDVGAPFKLATCGWVLGPQYDRALVGKVLPSDIAVSSINRNLGHDPVEPAYAEVKDHSKWAIPWMEDDPALNSLQLWAGRMRRDARDALAYGCDGLMGIHWRTRSLGPNVSALAQAAWDQTGWPDKGVRGSACLTDVSKLPQHPFADDFYADWASHEFGEEIGAEAAHIFSTVDGVLPQPSAWIGGPGGYVPDDHPWEEVSKEFGFVDDFAALASRVVGEGNRERFNYWLNQFQYLRETAHMKCAWGIYKQAMAEAQAQADPGEKKRIAREKALPARNALMRVIESAYGYLLGTVTTPGAMGSICNLEQHTFPVMVEGTAKELAECLGENLPPESNLTSEYQGQPRLFVPTVRTSLEEGEPLVLKVVLVDRALSKDAVFSWRPLGEGSFTTRPVQHVARGVYQVTLPAGEIRGRDFEYYLKVTTAGGQDLVWPPMGGVINQTVLTLP